MKASGTLPIVPMLSSSCAPIKWERGDINWAKWEDLGDVVLLHTTLSKSVHNNHFGTKTPALHQLFLQPGTTVDGRTFASKHTILPLARTPLFFPWKYQEPILS